MHRKRMEGGTRAERGVTNLDGVLPGHVSIGVSLAIDGDGLSLGWRCSGIIVVGQRRALTILHLHGTQ
jgi:hypothetical protein